MLKWARANGGRHYGIYTCGYAARGGHLEVLKWLKANGCRLSIGTCDSAAIGGHLEVLKWASANGPEWNSQICSYAADGGSLEVLKWLKANGASWDLEHVRACARINCHTHIVDWLKVSRANDKMLRRNRSSPQMTQMTE